MKGKSLNHVHTFTRGRKIFGVQFYMCAHPDCYDMKARTDLVGKRSLCAVCGQHEMILTKEDLKRAKPRCSKCSNTNEAREKRASEEGGAEGAPDVHETPEAERKRTAKTREAERVQEIEKRRERQAGKRKVLTLSPEEADRYKKDQHLIKAYMSLPGFTKEMAIAKVEEAKARAEEIKKKAGLTN